MQGYCTAIYFRNCMDGFKLESNVSLADEMLEITWGFNVNCTLDCISSMSIKKEIVIKHAQRNPTVATGFCNSPFKN